MNDHGYCGGGDSDGSNGPSRVVVVLNAAYNEHCSTQWTRNRLALTTVQGI